MSGVESKERWQSKIKSLRDGILHVYETKEFSDVNFIVSSRKFKGHRAIIGARSPKLSKMFLEKNSMIPKVTDYIIEDVSEEGFEKLVHYIYTEELMKCEDNDDILEAYRAAKKFEQKGMLAKCTALITQWKITSDNVCAFLNDASDVDMLKTRSVEFVKNNALSVLTSRGFLDLSDENLKELFEKECFKRVPIMLLLRNIIRWGQNQFTVTNDYKLVRELLIGSDKPILGKLGFQNLSSEELAEVTSEYCGLLTMEETLLLFTYIHKRGTNLPDWCPKEE